MPIRMVPDENKGQNEQRNIPRNKQGGSGLGGILSFLPMILGFLIKKPKLLMLLLAIGAIWYFTKDGCMNNIADVSNQETDLTKGATLDPDEFDKAEVFTPLAETSKNVLPERVSLQQYCPTRKNQGYQGSCVGWASSYAARTIMEAKATGKSPNSVAFSPSSLYNQIALPNCQGAYINKAMDVMRQRGVLPWNDFPYDESSCSSKPNSAGLQKMANYRTRGYNRLTVNEDPRGAIDLLAIKQNLAQGAPVVIGMMVGGSFMQGMQGQELWQPSRNDYNMRGFGGHAMCVIGYDDYKEGGSFQIMNSWGNEWGKDGFGWVRYNDFQYFTKEAYGLYPMGDAKKQSPTKFEMAFGLVQNNGGEYIPIRQVANNYFETSSSIAKMTKFKIEVANTIDCYTYIFGAEVNNTSYVLFPYTAKHSPYCGITGTRIFPRDHSLLADNEGNKDFFAILVTKQPIDYESVNKAINNASGNNYTEKVNNALGRVLKRGVKFQGNGKNIGFSTDTNGEEAIAMIIGVNKR
ncbi:MAG: C1 family peptidase [Bacteroidia bacterium]|nr:C1 family peptidase [Bacteroidia bacterium]